ncbi:MAG: hypothetical protein WGN25_03860 [Candidatus Electrothrix sp. GW3-4]|uniref:hypothetical protein n=1 Tax=Candidatus Electrothrix sp. GW3-4 TaxID=3126740 RepID=UPI0030D030B4
MLLLQAGDALAKKTWKPRPGEWYVRLIVTADDGRQDSGNFLGRLTESRAGLDNRDLPELPPPASPIGDSYLSIVFPHPEWKGQQENYTADFHGVPETGLGKKESWTFEICTHTPGIPVTLSWKGDEAVLRHSQLLDATTGRILVKKCSATSEYVVELTKDCVSFVWEYRGRGKGFPPRSG